MSKNKICPECKKGTLEEKTGMVDKGPDFGPSIFFVFPLPTQRRRTEEKYLECANCGYIKYLE